MPRLKSDGEGIVSMDAALTRFPECVACNQGVDENDASTPYTIVKGEHVHLQCSAVTELSAAYAKDVHDYLTTSKNATRPENAHPLLDEEETEELIEDFLLGVPAKTFAAKLENRDVAAFE
ncbi:MAG: hypothetical protein M3P26_15780, partial [Gemmatimonadota bacterium]|nr:hypothetical protein [Gemmatimonadota bacterium]